MSLFAGIEQYENLPPSPLSATECSGLVLLLAEEYGDVIKQDSEMFKQMKEIEKLEYLLEELRLVKEDLEQGETITYKFIDKKYNFQSLFPNVVGLESRSLNIENAKEMIVGLEAFSLSQLFGFVLMIVGAIIAFFSMNKWMDTAIPSNVLDTTKMNDAIKSTDLAIKKMAENEQKIMEQIKNSDTYKAMDTISKWSDEEIKKACLAALSVRFISNINCDVTKHDFTQLGIYYNQFIERYMSPQDKELEMLEKDIQVTGEATRKIIKKIDEVIHINHVSLGTSDDKFFQSIYDDIVDMKNNHDENGIGKESIKELENAFKPPKNDDSVIVLDKNTGKFIFDHNKFIDQYCLDKEQFYEVTGLVVNDHTKLGEIPSKLKIVLDKCVGINKAYLDFSVLFKKNSEMSKKFEKIKTSLERYEDDMKEYQLVLGRNHKNINTWSKGNEYFLHMDKIWRAQLRMITALATVQGSIFSATRKFYKLAAPQWKPK